MHVVGIKQIIERALVSYSGVTTSDGGAGGATLVDSTLAIDYDGQTVLITSGSYTGQARDIDGDTSSGTVTPSSNFGGVIVDGTTFLILSGIPAMAEFDDIKGGGWTNENLTTIDGLIDDIIATLGAVNTAAATGAVSDVKLAMAYIKQLVTALIALDALVGAIDATTTDSLHGKLGTDTELADYSLYDLLGGNAFKTNALSAMLGAFTAAQNLKAILGNLTTTKNLGGILGALTTTDNLKAILGAYTAAANLKAAIDTIKALVDTAETAGPYSYTDGGGEQTVVEDTAVTRRRIWLEFSNRNMTQTGTFKIYRKVDGSNYDLYVPQAVTVGAGDDRAWDAEFTTNQAWKLTYEEGVDETAARDIPYNVITQVIE